jgi:predicted MFS family arabinose efflux permease
MELTSRRERLLIAILASINFTHIMDFVIMMPLGPQFIRVFHIDTSQFALMVSSYTFAAAVSGVVCSLFIDRFDRKRALLCLYAGFIVGTLLCGFSSSYPLLVGARIVAGAFGGVAGGLVLAIVGDVIPPNRRGKALGIIMASFSVASVIGIPIGLYFATAISWRVPFVGLAAGSLLVLAAAMTGLPRLTSHLTNEAGRNRLREIRAVLAERNHIRAWLLTTALMFGGFTIIPFLSPYIVSNLKLAESQLSLFYLCGGACTFLTSQVIGRLADRFGKRRVYSMLAISSLVPILVVTHLPPVSLGVALIWMTVFMVLVSGRFVPAMALITGSTTPAHRGSFMSVNASVQQATAGSAAMVAGAFLVQEGNGPIVGYGTVGLLASAFTLLSLWAAARIELRS